MIAGKQIDSIGQTIVRSMRKAVIGSALNYTVRDQMSKIGIKRDLSQTNDHADSLQLLDLCGQMCRAFTNLLRCWFIAWRSTANH